MSTPFFVVDHKVGPHAAIPIEEKRLIRRGAAEPLRLSGPEAGMPTLHVLAARPVAPSPRPNLTSGAGWLTRLFRGLRLAPA